MTFAAIRGTVLGHSAPDNAQQWRRLKRGKVRTACAIACAPASRGRVRAPARLPESVLRSNLLIVCPGPDSNRHDGVTRRGILSPLCLPVSPPGLAAF